MKISVNWIKEFTDVKLSTEQLVKRIGAQLGEVEGVVGLSERYKDIVVAKVMSCNKHPNADKLSVCLIDDGEKTKGVKRDGHGYVQVVCGAPNVRKGITIAWIPPGAIVPSTFDNGQFKLEVRPLRGVDSNGMIASGKELEVSDDHNGILVIDKPAKPGSSFADLYELNDQIIEIENKMFTHRPDCFGILGVAREIAGIQKIKFKSPKWYQENLKLVSSSSKELSLKIDNKLPELVPRFMAQIISGVSVKPSPIIMQSYLTRLGLKPINNIVDITNFVMTLTGQPLHAYDYDKVAVKDKSKSATIVVRKPKKNEKVALLNGKTITPHSEAIMIATKTSLIGVGGAMGGTDTEVDDQTKNIIMECASFDMYSIRKTSMKHGLFTDAVTRFNKGQSALQNDRVIRYANAMVVKLAGGNIVNKEIDERAKPKRFKKVAVTTDFVNSRLGLDLTTSEIAKLLANVEFEIERDKTKLLIKPPFWRTDIEIPEDIVEEVGRLYGYDLLPLELPRRSLKPASPDKLQQIKKRIRQTLSSAGANELLTYSFVHGDLLTKTEQDPSQAYKLANALSPDLQYYRLTLTPSLLEKVHPNIKAGHDKFAIYEIGKSHNNTHLIKGSKLPEEIEMVALTWASKDKIVGAPFFWARQYLDALGKKLGLDLDYSPVTGKPQFAVTAPFDLDRSAFVTDKNSGEFLGIIGEYKTSVRRALKLPASCAGFEIGTQHLLDASEQKSQYRPLSKFPSTSQDISLKVKDSVPFSKVWSVIDKTIADNDKGYDYRVLPIDIYQPKVNSNVKHVTFRIVLSHPDRTLVTDEVSELLDSIAGAAKKELLATRL